MQYNKAQFHLQSKANEKKQRKCIRSVNLVSIFWHLELTALTPYPRKDSENKKVEFHQTTIKLPHHLVPLAEHKIECAGLLLYETPSRSWYPWASTSPLKLQMLNDRWT